MENKVYGVIIGCIHEGGSVGGKIYKNKAQAIKIAEEEFCRELAKVELYKRMVHDIPDLTQEQIDDYNTIPEFPWRKCEIESNRWHNEVDEIFVTEFSMI